MHKRGAEGATANRLGVPATGAACGLFAGVGFLAGAFGAIDPVAVIALQVACAILAAAVGIQMRKDPALMGSSLLLATWVLVGGFGGVLIWGLLALPRGRLLRLERTQTSQGRADDMAKQLHNQLIDGRLRIEGAHLIRPLRDVLATGTQAQKFRALNATARRYSVDLAPALRVALKDVDPAVRVLASSVMASLDARYLGRVRLATIRSQAEPANSVHWLELSQAFLAYAGSGLLSGERRREALDKAQEFQQRYEEIDQKTATLPPATTPADGPARRRTAGFVRAPRPAPEGERRSNRNDHRSAGI